MLSYLPDEERYEEVTKVPEGTRVLDISGTQVRDDYLAKGISLPEWFTRPETADILQQMYPPRHKQGVCIWFTGLSGSGKSTTAEILNSLLMERGGRSPCWTATWCAPTFPRAWASARRPRHQHPAHRLCGQRDRAARWNGITAAISPYRATRNEVRQMMGDEGFIEVYVNTPIEVCEQRDVKGMYARARRGQITGFTGVDDPYEEPVSPEITLYTTETSPEENAYKIIAYLEEKGYLLPDGFKSPDQRRSLARGGAGERPRGLIQLPTSHQGGSGKLLQLLPDKFDKGCLEPALPEQPLCFIILPSLTANR
jgi:sulfate adenylyltransferase